MGAILEAIENNPKEIKRLLGIDPGTGGKLCRAALEFTPPYCGLQSENSGIIPS